MSEIQISSLKWDGPGGGEGEEGLWARLSKDAYGGTDQIGLKKFHYA